MAESAEECLAAVADAQARTELFQVIFVDSHLPGRGFGLAEQLRDRFDLHQRTVMLIRSGDISSDMEKSGLLGLACNLVKSVRQQELADATCRALGMRFPGGNNIISETRKVPEALSPMHILLAEDNENKQILFSFYFKHTPHTVEIVANGKACVEKYTSGGQYDIIFMDIDMPVIDGYKATDTIRNWERENGRDPVPIIALTAHALAGKHQESLDAGCTDHISKPFKKEQLSEALSRYAATASVRTGQVPDMQSACEDPFSENEVEKPVVRVNLELRELIPSFMTITRQEIKTLEAAIREENYENIRRLGHRIKGSCLCYGFNAAADIARDVESAGNEKDTIENIALLAQELGAYVESAEVVFESIRGSD